MKLLYGEALAAALKRNEIVVPESGCAVQRLDEIRIGLTLSGTLITDISEIDSREFKPTHFKRLEFTKAPILPHHFYLGTSHERIRIPPNVIGQMFTRSKYARVGLEFALSSSFIFPGYGWHEPTPFVFEISARAAPVEVAAGEIYAFLVLFTLDDPIHPKPVQSRTFPFVEGGLDA
jgi:deoxycytidine triphosphate deaminase